MSLKTIAAASLLLLTTSAFAEDRYSISLLGLYGYNGTFGHSGGFDLTGFLPINKNFEMDAAFEFQSPQIYAVTAVARPKFALPVGEIFLDGAIHFRSFGTYDIGNFSMAASLGYRMDYVNVQIGLSTNIICDMLKQYGDSYENVAEPFNLLYRLGFNVRPVTSVWNLGFGVTNFTLYEYERTWQPHFYLNGHYDFYDHLSALLEADFKPSGNFHMSAQFWGVNVRAGIKYSF